MKVAFIPNTYLGNFHFKPGVKESLAKEIGANSIEYYNFLMESPSPLNGTNHFVVTGDKLRTDLIRSNFSNVFAKIDPVIVF